MSGTAKFIFDGEGGMIAGWSPGIDSSGGHQRVHRCRRRGLQGPGDRAERRRIHSCTPRIFTTTKSTCSTPPFIKQATSATAFTFADPSVPAGYAPFGIQADQQRRAAASTQIYVTYAKQQAPDNHDNANGAGLGYVDIYDTNGKLIKQWVANGGAQCSLGVALAPDDFGTLSKALLVGNFGDGSDQRLTTRPPASSSAPSKMRMAPPSPPRVSGA